MKEKWFLGRKTFKHFACGAQKVLISNVFWFKTGPNSLKSSLKGAKKNRGRLFLNFRFLRFSSVLPPKTLQNHLKSDPGGAPGGLGGAPATVKPLYSPL